LDCPETDWKPFGSGANSWPDQPEGFISWTVSPDGRRAGYDLRKDQSRLRFEAWVEGHSVYFRFHTQNVATFHGLSSLCLKTISPFFCTQERLLQGVVLDGRLGMVHQMPSATTNPFFWVASDYAPDNCSGILRSYDGTAYMARVARPPCRPGGNSSIPCMHMGEWAGELPKVPQKVDGEGGKIVFLIGSLDELKRELQYPKFDAP